MATTIVIADDHQIFRQGLRTLLQREPDFQLVGEAATGSQAIAMIHELKPDIAVIDITMPGIDGIEATRQLHEQSPTKVLGLSMHTEPRFVRDMIRAGASGYLLKDDAFDELVRALRTVLAGGTYYSKRINWLSSSSGNIACSVDRLSPRERQVLQLIAEGQSTKEIAYKLKLSTKTIETHRRQIMQKLDLYSVAELTKCAIREGLTNVDVPAPTPITHPPAQMAAQM